MAEDIYGTITFMEQFRFSRERQGNVFIGKVREMPVHMHDGIELIYVLKGRLSMRISFNRYELTAGDFLLVNAYEVHRISAEPAAEILFLQLNMELFKGREFAFDLSFFKKCSQEPVKKVKTCMQHAWLLDQKGEEAFKINACMEETAALCDRYFQVNQYDAVNKKQAACAKHRMNRERMQEIYEYIYENYPNKLTLTEIADMEYLDMFYASRLIKDGMGTSFQNTLNIIRADRAEVFLLGTDLPVQQVGETVGFSSHTYFIRHFKNLFGMTPSAYRKKYADKTYPRKRMEYERISYDPELLYQLTERLEGDEKERTQEQYLEELESLLQYAAHLCAKISSESRQQGDLTFSRNEQEIQAQLPHIRLQVKNIQKK